MAVYYGYGAADRMTAALYDTADQAYTTVALLRSLPSNLSGFEAATVGENGIKAVTVAHDRFVPAGAITPPYAVKTTIMASHYAVGPATYPAFGWANADELDFGYYYGESDIVINAVAVFEGETTNPNKLIVAANLTVRPPSLAPPYTITRGSQALFEPYTLAFGVPFAPDGA